MPPPFGALDVQAGLETMLKLLLFKRLLVEAETVLEFSVFMIRVEPKCTFSLPMRKW